MHECATSARMRSEGLGLPVCLCVSGASVRPEIDIAYSTGNEGQKFEGFSLKLLRCGDPQHSLCRPASMVRHLFQKPQSIDRSYRSISPKH